MLAEYSRSDRNAELDYSIGLSQWLTAGEIIVASTWAISPAGVTNMGASFSTTETTIWLPGGIVGKKYRVTNSITTNSVPPRQDHRSLQIAIEER